MIFGPFLSHLVDPPACCYSIVRTTVHTSQNRATLPLKLPWKFPVNERTQPKNCAQGAKLVDESVTLLEAIFRPHTERLKELLRYYIENPLPSYNF